MTANFTKHAIGCKNASQNRKATAESLEMRSTGVVCDYKNLSHVERAFRSLKRLD
jgi:hypothetical protein